MSAERPRFSLTLLGGCAVARPDGELLAGRASQRRRLACLAVIAIAGRSGVSRDQLLALLWPESTTEQARHRLADTLHVLRAALGEDALPGTGDRVSLSPDVVGCDAAAFDDAVRRGDVAAAAAAYTGPFLDGFHVGDAPEFERWADGERDHRARKAASAFEALARQADAAGDTAGAVAWWRRLAAADPLGGRAALGLARALDVAGDRAGALRHLRVHTALLAQELGTPPDPEVRALAERLQSASPDAVVRGDVRAPPAPPPNVPDLPSVPPDGEATPTTGTGVVAAPAAAPQAGPATHAGTPARTWTRNARRVALLSAPAVVAALGSAAWLSSRAHPTSAPRTVRFVLAEGRGATVRGAPTLTPDGRAVVVDGAGDDGDLLVRALGDLRARPLSGTVGAHNPFVSPDGRSVAFLAADDRLAVMPLDGATSPRVLAAAPRYTTGGWGPGGALVIDYFGPLNGLGVVDTGGAPPHPLTRPDTAHGERLHVAPCVLPGGRAVVFTVQRRTPGTTAGELAVVTLDSRAAGPAPHTRLGISGRTAVGVVDGLLVYVAPDGRDLMAAPFDITARRVTGPPATVLHDPEGSIAAATLTADGTLLYTRSAKSHGLVLVDARGGARPLGAATPTAEEDFMGPQLSPDGGRVLLGGPSPNGVSDVWVYDLASATLTRLTTIGYAGAPAWTPDGRRVVFRTADGARRTFWSQPADASAPAERLFEIDGPVRGSALVVDGRSMLVQHRVDGNWGFWAVRVDGDPRSRVPRPILTAPYDVSMPALAPDGRWLAYVSGESGREEVYVRPFPGPGAAAQVSERGGTEPVWAPDGRRLVYRTGRDFVAASVGGATAGAASGIAVTARTPLFRDTFIGGMPHVNYAVMPDGQHFLMFGDASGKGPETVVVVNWLPELRAAIAAAAGAQAH